MKNKYAEILIPQKIQGNSDFLTYQIPLENNEKFLPGKIVEISLRNRLTRGLIFKIHDQSPSFNTKTITRLIEGEIELSDLQIDLMKYISDQYFCPLYKVMKLFIPANTLSRKRDFKANQAKIKKINTIAELTLTEDQKLALSQINKSEKNTILLHGITGSGKTEIYRQLTTQILSTDKQVLIMVPEISLTPQTVRNFQDRFGEKIAIVHSRLTAKEKINYLHQVNSGEIKILVGSRSAIFAPFKELGLIIIDEEHEDSYKQDQSPRYHVLDIAQKICSDLAKKGSPIKLILGSATPSIESYFQTLNGNYDLVKLNKRIEKEGIYNKLPEITLVDLREEIKKKNFSIFSEKLQEKIKSALSQKEQVILFLNRRGAASAVICRDCGYAETCPSCDVPLTYHSKITLESSILPAERLLCHHCGKIYKIPLDCKQCHSHLIKYIGIGTQKIETELQKIFPNAKILRADRDTTKHKNAFAEIYNDFKDSKADILIGTQMIGKGLHLPNVTLVGVILAETTLTIPDYRSAEKTFQLLTQVAGRSGREKPGEVVIQTYMPEHYAIQYTLKHNYEGFFEYEKQIREQLNYPPFGKLLKLTIEDSDQEKANYLSHQLYNEIKAELPNPLIKEINIYPALITKLKNKYRWHILLEGANPQQFLKNYSLRKPLKNDIKIDVNPLSTV